MTNSDLAGVIDDLDEAFVQALADALAEDPELIETTLRDYGFFTDGTANTRNEEAISSLTDSEQRLYNIVSGLSGPKSIEQLIDTIERNHGEFAEAYGSYSDRSWLNRKLNALVERGLIGKFREGRTVMYTAEITEAVRHWALHNDQFVQDLSSKNVDTIVADTGMPKAEVARAVTELTS